MVKSSLTQTLPCVTSPWCIYGGLILCAWCWCKIWLWMTFPCGSSCRGWQTSNRFNIITPQHHNKAIITTLCCKYVQRVCTCVNLTANSTLINMVLWTGLINKRVNIKSIMRLHNPPFFKFFFIILPVSQCSDASCKFEKNYHESVSFC